MVAVLTFKQSSCMLPMTPSGDLNCPISKSLYNTGKKYIEVEKNEKTYGCNTCNYSSICITDNCY
jgi:hypothetical protein